MDKKNIIENEIEKTLKLLEESERLTPNPFFYAKIEEKLKEKGGKNRLNLSLIMKPVALIALILLNITTIAMYVKGDDATSRSEIVSILSSDFGAGNFNTDILNLR
ncbi:hypothetical protein DSN97_02015 [Deferribacteraceae bacterium V6Fe1]|nr:hypothetical protein DSN97_02015 [Deferribacteraceae bacterium V6Fe1]